MSLSAQQSYGGGFPTAGGGGPFPPLNISSFLSLLPTATSFVTILNPTTTTFSTTSHTTFSTTFSTTSTTIVTTTSPVTVIPTATLAAQDANIKSTEALARNTLIISAALGGMITLLLILIAILFCIWISRRRRGRGDNSPPLTSLAPTNRRPSQTTRQIHATSLSMGPRSGSFAPAFISHPPNRDSVPLPFYASDIPVAMPAINIQPNMPSVLSREDVGPATGVPLYFQTVPEEGEVSEGTGRLAPPALERSGSQRSESASVSSVGSDLYEPEPEPPVQRERIMHSTRASSGVFPDA